MKGFDDSPITGMMLYKARRTLNNGTPQLKSLRKGSSLESFVMSFVESSGIAHMLSHHENPAILFVSKVLFVYCEDLIFRLRFHQFRLCMALHSL